jgi:hypothetical protein
MTLSSLTEAEVLAQGLSKHYLWYRPMPTAMQQEAQRRTFRKLVLK